MASGFEFPNCGVQARAYSLVQIVPVFGRQADGHRLGAAECRGSRVGTGGIARVVSLYDFKKRRDVVGIAGERPALIETRRECHHAIPRDAAIRGLEPRHAAERGGLANRSSGIGAGGAGYEPGADRGRRPPGRPAGRPARIPGVARGAKPTGLVGRSHREFIHVGLAETYGAGGGQLADDRRIVRRDEIPKHSGCARRAHALGTEDILVRQGNTRQWFGFAPRDTFIRGLRCGQRVLACDRDETVESFVAGGDAREEVLGQFDGTIALVQQAAPQFGDGFMRVHRGGSLHDPGHQVETVSR